MAAAGGFLGGAAGGSGGMAWKATEERGFARRGGLGCGKPSNRSPTCCPKGMKRRVGVPGTNASGLGCGPGVLEGPQDPAPSHFNTGAQGGGLNSHLGRGWAGNCEGTGRGVGSHFPGQTSEVELGQGPKV